MLIVGLTGGIGCGKSTVADLFSQLEVPVVDADIVARDLVAQDQPALLAIKEFFGSGIIGVDGNLDRLALKGIIFGCPEKKRQLEAIMHPLIYQSIRLETERLASQNTTPYCMICLPLLFETQADADFIDRVLVIDCPIEEQILRVQKRDNMDIGTLQAIIASQVPRAFRLAHANDIIDNTRAGGELAEQVKKLHNLYLSISPKH